VTLDLFNLTGLALGLGLLGFIEPCTIGAHMLFLNSQCDRPMRTRVGALAAFMLARLLVMGGLGGVFASRRADGGLRKTHGFRVLRSA
jgi:cytochrome c-type biogenesis protein